MSEVIVVDSNIIFSTLVSAGPGVLRQLQNWDYAFLAPSFLIEELLTHAGRIESMTKLVRTEFIELLIFLSQRLEIIHPRTLSVGSFVEASRLCHSVDPADIPFVALALERSAKLWTRDDTLKAHLIKNGFESFFEPDTIELDAQ